MSKFIYKHLAIFLIMASFLNIKAQSLEQTLSNLSSDAADAYVSPLVSAFGSNLNSGWVQKVPEAQVFGIDINLKFVGMGSFFSDQSKTFSKAGLFRFNSEQVDRILTASNIYPYTQTGQSIKTEILSRDWNVNISGPTIVGDKKDKLYVEFPGANIQGQQVGVYKDSLGGIGGYLNNLPIFPSAAVQLTLGTVYGTALSIRYLPSINIQDIGKLSFFGIGALNNINIWLPNPLPLDLGVGVFYQKLTVGDIFEGTALQYGAYASKTFGGTFAVTPYAGLTVENSTTTTKYSYNFDTPYGPQTALVSFNQSGENSIGFTLGSTFKLAILNINIDYKLAQTNTLSGGLSFGF
jgi:Family of unknown function (DUF6588)